MDIALDEWLVHFICDPSKQVMTQQLLEAIYEKCDCFVTVEGSPLISKIWRMCRKARTLGGASGALAQLFIHRFLVNPAKFRTIPHSAAPVVSPQIEAAVKPDDTYLARAALATPDKFILTTDRPLKDALDGKHGLTVRFVDEFLAQCDCQTTV